MDIKLEEALTNVETTYGELIEIANDILDPILLNSKKLVDEINLTINHLTIDQIRDYILQLQLTAFTLSEIKEKSAMKAELASAIQKEQYALKFNSMDGSAAAKDKLALVAISAEVASTTLYNLIASMLKTKLDQLHRLCDALKSILMSRMQETKFMNIGSSSEIPPTRQILNE